MFDDKENNCIFAECFYRDNKMDENKIVIYQTEDGQTQIDVRFRERDSMVDSGPDGRAV